MYTLYGWMNPGYFRRMKKRVGGKTNVKPTTDVAKSTICK